MNFAEEQSPFIQAASAHQSTLQKPYWVDGESGVLTPTVVEHRRRFSQRTILAHASPKQADKPSEPTESPELNVYGDHQTADDKTYRAPQIPRTGRRRRSPLPPRLLGDAGRARQRGVRWDD